MNIQKTLRYGSNSIIASHGNFGRLASFFMISPVGFQKTCIQNLSFLHSLEVAQKFVVEEPKIILRSQRLYGVERDFSVSFGPRPKLNNK